jgi:hypothetical protein
VPMRVCLQTDRTCFYLECSEIPPMLTAFRISFPPLMDAPAFGLMSAGGHPFFRWLAHMSLTLFVFDDWRRSVWQ